MEHKSVLNQVIQGHRATHIIVDDIEPKIGLKFPCGHIQRIALEANVRGIRHKGMSPCLACAELEVRAKAEALSTAPIPFVVEGDEIRRFIK